MPKITLDLREKYLVGTAAETAPNLPRLNDRKRAYISNIDLLTIVSSRELWRCLSLSFEI